MKRAIPGAGRTLVSDAVEMYRLYAAWDKVRGNRGCGGVDGVSLQKFEAGLERRLDSLRNSVLSGNYAPRPLLEVFIPKSESRLRRLLIPTVRDRVLQTAFAELLKPELEREFEDCSFGYRPGRGVRTAVQRVSAYHRSGLNWVVDADIRSYFDNVCHYRLILTMRSIFRCPELERYLWAWLRTSVHARKRQYALTKGVPQGSPISPLLANTYLDVFDEWLLDRKLGLVRYADDFVILCNSEAQAREALAVARSALGAIKLELNTDKTRITDFDRGFKFLGVNFVRTLVL